MKNFEIKDGVIYIGPEVSADAADFIVSKFDNFYDANGLIDLWIGTNETNKNRTIEPVWNADYKRPSDEELIKMLEDWNEEFIKNPVENDCYRNFVLSVLEKQAANES